MHNVIKGTRTFLLAVGLAALGPVVPAAACAETAAAAKPDMKKVTQHLKEHQTYRPRAPSCSRRATTSSTSPRARSAGTPTACPRGLTSRRPRC